MAGKQSKRLSGTFLAGVCIAPAIMSTAQQNIANADFSSKAEQLGNWFAKQWGNPIGKTGIILSVAGLLATAGYLTYLITKTSHNKEHTFGSVKSPNGKPRPNEKISDNKVEQNDNDNNKIDLNEKPKEEK